MQPDKLPDVLTIAEVEALLAAPNQRCPTGLRNHVLLTTLYRTAMRSDEARSLQPRHIRWQDGILSVREGKGARDRNIRISKATVQCLRRWADVRPRGETFFCTLRGSKLGGRYLRRMIKRMARRVGIEDSDRVHPHLLRHTRATHMRQQGVDLHRIQRHLGHKNLETTTIYDHIVQGEMEETMEQLDAVLP